MNGNFRVGEFLIEPQLNTITGGERTARVEPKVMQVHSPDGRYILFSQTDPFVYDLMLVENFR